MVIEIVVRRPEDCRDVDLEERLAGRVGLLDKPEVERRDASLADEERSRERRVVQECWTRALGLVGRLNPVCSLARRNANVAVECVALGRQ